MTNAIQVNQCPYADVYKIKEVQGLPYCSNGKKCHCSGCRCLCDQCKNKLRDEKGCSHCCETYVR